MRHKEEFNYFHVCKSDAVKQTAVYDPEALKKF